jgi:hypothetical protein
VKHVKEHIEINLIMGNVNVIKDILIQGINREIVYNVIINVLLVRILTFALNARGLKEKYFHQVNVNV